MLSVLNKSIELNFAFVLPFSKLLTNSKSVKIMDLRIQNTQQVKYANILAVTDS